MTSGPENKWVVGKKATADVVVVNRAVNRNEEQ